jgi:hypothetical protein
MFNIVNLYSLNSRSGGVVSVFVVVVVGAGVRHQAGCGSLSGNPLPLHTKNIKDEGRK